MTAFPLSTAPSAEVLAQVGERWTEAMLCGDYEEAWMQTDRIELHRRTLGLERWSREPHHLLWDGASFLGKHVLVRCEHGLGDSIQFLRYAPLLRKLASRVTLRLQPSLLALFRGMAGVDELVDAWTVEPDPPHEVLIECMELPYAFRHSISTIPCGVPYLPVERLLRDVAPLDLGRATGAKVGLVWAASDWNPKRSISLDALAILNSAPAVTFYSLQQGQHEEDPSPFPLQRLSHHTQQVEQAARAMLQMDVIITVDSMTAHLAGALGRPVYLLLTHKADWRWMQHSECSPWYPTMKIFRQGADGDWTAAVQAILALLNGRRNDAANIPVATQSLGSNNE